MVEDILVNFNPFMSARIRAGRDFLQSMDDADLPVTDAFWRYVEEDDHWWLYIATPIVGREGLRETARRIRQVLDGMPHRDFKITLSDIRPVDPGSTVIGLVRQRYGKIDKEMNLLTAQTDFDKREPYIYRLGN